MPTGFWSSPDESRVPCPKPINMFLFLPWFLNTPLEKKACVAPQWSPVHIPHQTSTKKRFIFLLGQCNQPGAPFLCSPLIDAAQTPGVGKGDGSDHPHLALVIVSSILGPCFPHYFSHWSPKPSSIPIMQEILKKPLSIITSHLQLPTYSRG